MYIILRHVNVYGAMSLVHGCDQNQLRNTEKKHSEETQRRNRFCFHRLFPVTQNSEMCNRSVLTARFYSYSEAKSPEL